MLNEAAVKAGRLSEADAEANGPEAKKARAPAEHRTSPSRVAVVRVATSRLSVGAQGGVPDALA